MLVLPATRPVPPSPGGRLAVDDIVGRDADVLRIWTALRASSAPLLLTEPRRLGKSVTLRKLCAERPAGWEASYRSYQGVDTVAGMCQGIINDLAVHEGLTTRMRKRLGGFLATASVSFQGVTLQLAPEFRDDPVSALEAALRAVSEDLGSRYLALVCDEVPDMIAGIEATEGKQAALRAMALWRAHREDMTTQNVRWILTGSVGFHHIVRLLGRADLLNDLLPVGLGPLSPEWTRWLAESVLLGAGMHSPQPDAVDELARLSGGFAMVIHLVGALVRDREIRSATGDQISQLLDTAFGDLDATQQFTSFLTRLAPYYGPDEPHAVWLLDELARGAKDRPTLMATRPPARAFRDEEHLRSILDWLTADHYLVHEDDTAERTYRWRYEPMRRLWAQRRR